MVYFYTTFISAVFIFSDVLDKVELISTGRELKDIYGYIYIYYIYIYIYIDIYIYIYTHTYT